MHMTFNCNPDFFTEVWRQSKAGDTHLRSANSLAFPVHDIALTEAGDLIINFFNCLNADSVMPHYLLELSLKNNAFFDFVHLFNEKIYRWYYALLVAVHPFLGSSTYHPLTVGLKKSVVTVVSWKLFLKKILGKIPFVLTEYSACWLPVENKAHLGLRAVLSNTLLGNRFFSAQCSVLLRIGPVLPGDALDLKTLKSALTKIQKTVALSVVINYKNKGFHLGGAQLGDPVEAVTKQFVL